MRTSDKKFIKACYNNQIDKAKELLAGTFVSFWDGTHVAADINARNNDGKSGLMSAAAFGHREIVQFLIDKGADISLKDNDGSTAFHFAAEGGHIDILTDLLTQGALIDARNDNGHTPLMKAASEGRTTAVDFLIGKKADVNIRDFKG